MKIEYLKSPNFEQVKRRNIKYIIIHYTGMKTAQESIKRLRSKKHKVSSHYFINERGKITQLVNDKDIAWHAGISNWKKDRNLNSKSIGIELQNKGKEFGYHKFKLSQIKSLISLIESLQTKYKIKKSNILGHSDIAPLRKIDPGYLFPWHKLAAKGLVILPKKNNSKKTSGIITDGQIRRINEKSSKLMPIANLCFAIQCKGHLELREN